jgi:hypothetical protein
LALGTQELATGGIFPHAISGFGGLIFAVILLVASLGLIFAGRSLIKGLSFVVVGLAGAAAGLAAGGLLLGWIGAAIGALVGFIVGGMIGVLLLHVGMGLALGYFGFLATRDLSHSFLIAVAVGVVLFFVGVAISNKLMELVTSIIGGVILYEVLLFFALAPLYAGLVSLVLGAAGFYVQETKRRRSQPWRQDSGRVG